MKFKVLVGLTDECPTEEQVEVHAVGGYPVEAVRPDDEHAHAVIRDEEELSEWAERRYDIHRIAQIEVREEHMTLPVYKTIDETEHMTREEAMAFHDNEPVAGTEFREMATLFMQMHEFVCDVVQCHRLSKIAGDEHAHHRTGPAGWPEEAVRIMNARAQSFQDRTRNFTRPIRT